MGYSYEYYFDSHGTTKSSKGNESNEIWIDTGGGISKGIFDHHDSAGKYVSTVDVLVNETELLEETIISLNPNEPVRIYMHENPDVDCLMACYFLIFYLEKGKNEYIEKLVEGAAGRVLTQYVNDIDSGNKKNTEELTLYNLICHLDCDEVKEYWNITDNYELSNKMVSEALIWIEKVYNILKENPYFDIYDAELSIDENDFVAQIIYEKSVKTGKYNYERDKRENRLVIKDIDIWTKSGEVKTVKAAIWKDVPLSPRTAYNYARKEGAVLTFVPHREYGNNAARVSINPNIEGAVEKFSLMELVEVYENLEQICDKKELAKTGSLRRDYSRPRGNDVNSIFHEKPFSLTVDPWYISDKADMVDAPGKGGSLIPIDVMINVLENITKMVKRTILVEYDLDVSKKYISNSISIRENIKESLFTWVKTEKARLDKLSKDKYPLIICEVDASLIAHNYDILDAYFMTLSDGAYIDADNKTVLRIDYRTHLYVNQSNAVLFIATSDANRSLTQADGLIDWSNENTVKESSLIEIFSKILYQREKFKEIGRFLGAFKENSNKIKKQNEELISLLAKAQADECMDLQVELDVFEFIYNALNVQDLKESVKDTMAMVSEYSKERVYANLNFLSIITIPFILFSTLFQMGVLRFEPVLDLNAGNMSVPTYVPWAIFLLIVVIITTIFLFARKKK